MRLMTEFALLELSEYLVGNWLVGIDKSRLNESAIIMRSSPIDEWWRNKGSQWLSWMLKSLVIIRRLWIFALVFFRYFKAEWEELEYTFMIQKILSLLKKETRRISLWLKISLQREN